MFLLLHLVIFSIAYFLCHDGKGDNSAHRLSLASRHATSMGSDRFILKVRFKFLHIFGSCFFYYIWDSFQLCTFCAMMGKVKTQPTDWVWPPAPIAALPTLRGSGRYVLRVSCLFLHHFCSCLLLHLIFILIKYSLFWHGNGENSAHRLSLVTRSYHCLAITDTQQWVYFEGKFS
jgi:hypothetical protein